MSDIITLENKILKYSTEYYSGTSTISDQEFDRLLQELYLLDPYNELLTTTSYGYKVSSRRKVDHNISLILETPGIRMIKFGSLDKIRSLKDNPIRLYSSISAKLDGISMMLYFKNGELVNAITRGDGYSGLSVTGKLSTIIKGNYKYDPQFTGVVRGEVIMTDKSWVDHFQDEYSNPRNAVSGIINSIEDHPNIDKLNFIPYKVYSGKDETNTTYLMELNYLSTLFKDIVPHLIVEPALKPITEDYLEDIFDDFKVLYGYPMDGLVITDRMYNSTFNLGYDADKYDEIAYKFPSEFKWTTLLDIEWTKSRLGKYIPVAIIDPIELSGTSVSRVTLFNYEYVVSTKLTKGSLLKITKSGEIIPHVLQVDNSKVDEYLDLLPNKCTVCSSDLAISGVDLVCPNLECDSLSDTKYWISTLTDITGLGSSILDKYLNEYKLYTISSLYSLRVDKYLERDLKLGDTSQRGKFLRALSDLRGTHKVVRVLEALNIPLLGPSNASKFDSQYGLEVLDELSRSDITNLGTIVDPNYALYSNIKKYLPKFSVLGLVQYTTSTDTPDQRLKVSITGSLRGFSRKSFLELYNDKIQEVDISDAEYLITNSTESTSSKYKYAKSHDISILTQEDAEDLLSTL